jgi:D-amino-acid oxidase
MSHTQSRQVTVVGAGVNGLATAVELQRRGHHVQVIAESTYESTVSSVAGAIWLPYQVGVEDRARVRLWAQQTRDWLSELARGAPAAGVDVLDAYELPATDEPLWWADGLEGVERVAAPVPGAPLAWRFRAPRAQPSLLLRYFADQLHRPVQRRRVGSFAELADLPGELVVNCTGLGARTLLDDTALCGVFGQVALAGCGGVPRGISLTDERDPTSLFYIIPRRDELVLGGIARPEPGVTVPPAEPAITERVLRHAARLGLEVGEVTAVRVGLRPYRPSVRLERDTAEPRILHNYGHGGSGFTLCHGTARAIAELVAA